MTDDDRALFILWRRREDGALPIEQLTETARVAFDDVALEMTAAIERLVAAGHLRGTDDGWELTESGGDVARPAAKRVITDHLALIDQLDTQVAALENDLVLTPEQDAAVRLLKTIPGVGPVIATTIVAEIGDVRRFNSPKALCNWAGLTPRIRSSAGITRHGHISKEGSPFLRNAMTQATMIASRISKRWRLVYETLSRRCGKKAARVAVARRLLTVVYYMLKRNEAYQENYSQSPVSRGA